MSTWAQFLSLLKMSRIYSCTAVEASSVLVFNLVPRAFSSTIFKMADPPFLKSSWRRPWGRGWRATWRRFDLTSQPCSPQISHARSWAIHSWTSARGHRKSRIWPNQKMFAQKYSKNWAFFDKRKKLEGLGPFLWTFRRLSVINLGEMYKEGWAWGVWRQIRQSLPPGPAIIHAYSFSILTFIPSKKTNFNLSAIARNRAIVGLNAACPVGSEQEAQQEAKHRRKRLQFSLSQISKKDD